MDIIKVYCVSQAFWLGLKQNKSALLDNINKATYALVVNKVEKQSSLKGQFTQK